MASDGGKVFLIPGRKTCEWRRYTNAVDPRDTSGDKHPARSKRALTYLERFRSAQRSLASSSWKQLADSIFTHPQPHFSTQVG